MAVKKRETLPEYGRHFGKYDLERWGDFAEMSYLHGVSYGRFGLKLSDREKGRQMLAKFPKIKAGLQDCYFDKDLKRIFIGEAYKPLYKTLAKESLERNKKFLSPRGFLNPGFPKLHSTPGDHYGTFAGKYEAFSAKTRPPEKKAPVKRNFYSAPGRKGSYGFVNTCINPYPRYPESGVKYEEKPPPGRKYALTNPPFKGPSPPDFFDKNPYPEPTNANMNQSIYKKFVDQRWLLSKEFRPAGRGKPLGGHKGGGFSAFPIYIESRYIDPWKIFRSVAKPGKSIHPQDFLPQVRNKTKAMFSIVNINVDKKVTAENFSTIRPITFTREFLG